MEIGHWPMIRTASLSMHVPSSHWNRTRISRYAPTSMLSQRDIGGTGRALSNCVFLRRLRVRRENTAEPAQQTLKQYIFYLLRYCVFCTPHVRNVGIPPKFYLPGICLGGSQSAVAARFLVVVPYGVGLSLQIEVRKLVLNPEFEKVKGPWLFTSQRPFW